MNEIPQGIQVLSEGYGDTPHPDVQRDEMDRGPVNQELLNSRVRYTMNVTFLMESRQLLSDLLDWYRNTIRIIGWFDMPHPRTGQTIRVRLVGGELGTPSSIAPNFRASTLATTLEYYA